MKIILAVCTLFFSIVTSAASLNKMVVFGDSLSDDGNLYEYMQHQLPLSPPYFKGRFSNGPVWVELLMQYYYPNSSKAHLADYAYGGAGVLEDEDDDDTMFTLRREMDSYFLTHDKADPDSMFVVWIGSNNYLAIPDELESTVDAVILGIQHGLERLAQKGAKYILVVNVPDLGRTPLARELDVVDRMSFVAKLHNDKLKNKLAELQRLYPDVQWLYFDVNLVFDDMTNEPGRFGFTNVMDTCYEDANHDELTLKHHSLLKMVSRIQRQEPNEDACKGHLFFDPVHPTGPAHVLMAERTKTLFDKEGIEFRE